MIAIWGGVLLLAILAAGLTESALAVGRLNTTTDDLLFRPRHTASPTPKPSPSVTATPSATPTPPSAGGVTPVPATPTPNVAMATTNAFVHMRASNSTSSAILTDLNGGTKVELLPYRDAQWQKVKYNGLIGYIFTSYLTY